MQFPEFDPVLFSIGPLDIRWYALAYVAGIVLGWWYANRLARNTAVWKPGKPPVTTLQLDDLVLWITLGIILGGLPGFQTALLRARRLAYHQPSTIPAT